MRARKEKHTGSADWKKAGRPWPASGRGRAPLLALCLALALGLSLIGCGPPGDDAARAARVTEMYAGYKAKDFPRIRDLSGGEIMALAKDRPVVLVDVREPYERAVSTLPGALSEDQFLARRATLGNATVVAYCTIGYRSGMFVRGMAHLNATVYNLRGGILGWLHAGGNLTDSRGQPVQRVHVYGSTWNLAPLKYQAVW